VGRATSATSAKKEDRGGSPYRLGLNLSAQDGCAAAQPYRLQSDSTGENGGDFRTTKNTKDTKIIKATLLGGWL
jgi:hypothetical protein